MAAPCSNSSRRTRLSHHADARNGVALRRKPACKGMSRNRRECFSE